jgi:hypothetical protein
MCVCIVALVTQHAMRMRLIIYCHLWPVHLYHIFLKVCHKRPHCREEIQGGSNMTGTICV